MVEGIPLIELETGKEGFVCKVISSVLFEVELYGDMLEDKEPEIKCFKVSEENKKWKFVY